MMMDGDDDDLILLSNKHGLQKRERQRQRDIRELIGDWGLGIGGFCSLHASSYINTES